LRERRRKSCLGNRRRRRRASPWKGSSFVAVGSRVLAPRSLARSLAPLLSRQSVFHILPPPFARHLPPAFPNAERDDLAGPYREMLATSSPHASSALSDPVIRAFPATTTLSRGRRRAVLAYPSKPGAATRPSPTIIFPRSRQRKRFIEGSLPFPREGFLLPSHFGPFSPLFFSPLYSSLPHGACRVGPRWPLLFFPPSNGLHANHLGVQMARLKEEAAALPGAAGAPRRPS